MNFTYKIEPGYNYIFINKMDKSESVLIQVPFNKLVLKKKYMIITKKHGIIFTGIYYCMFGPSDIIGDMLGLGQPCFIDFKPNIENKSLLICDAYDKFYDLKVKTE
uniref:Uncharacterized protein n=1 Tax=viral metagenome TaxID=1070528 RepID=A0A6C0D3K7_9ZZZZ